VNKILVIPTEPRKLYIHPETKQEFPSGKVVEAEKDWFVKAKLNMGHLKEVEQMDNSDSGNPDGNTGVDVIDNTPLIDEQLSLEAFEKLSAPEQSALLVKLQLASDEKDEAISNKEKRVALYQGYLNGAGK